jgi:hypothetical protein
LKKDNNENKGELISEQQNRFVINNELSLSEIKVYKTNFVVASHFSEKHSFVDVMGKVIEQRIKAY